MRCPVCEANKDGKCMAGVVPYKSKRELDGIGCNMNRRTVNKKMKEVSNGRNLYPKR